MWEQNQNTYTHTQRPIHVWGGGVCSCGLGLSGFEQGSLEDGSELSGTCHYTWGTLRSAKLHLPTIFLYGVSCDRRKRVSAQNPTQRPHTLPSERETLKESGIFLPRHNLLQTWHNQPSCNSEQRLRLKRSPFEHTMHTHAHTEETSPLQCYLHPTCRRLTQLQLSYTTSTISFQASQLSWNA